MERYLLGGDTGVEAFKLLYQRFAPKVYGYLRKQLRDQVLADEVFQQTMLRFHETRNRYDPRFPLGPWMFTLTKNCMLDALRREQRRREEALPDYLIAEEPSAPPEIPLSTLPNAQRQAIEMRYYNDLNFSEIAKNLNVSETNTRQMISRAIRKLRGVMQGDKA